MFFTKNFGLRPKNIEGTLLILTKKDKKIGLRPKNVAKQGGQWLGIGLMVFLSEISKNIFPGQLNKCSREYRSYHCQTEEEG